MSLASDEKDQIIRIEVLDDDPGAADTTIYKAWAEPGTATSAATWRIQQTISLANGNITKLFADGNLKFDNVYDDRVSLSYS